MNVVDNAVVASLLRDSLEKGSHPCLTVISESMLPLLRINDDICLASCSVHSLRVGDIVVVESADSLITHRLRAVIAADETSWLITRGDRPLTYDAPWRAEQLVGRVCERRRRGKRLDLTSGIGTRVNNGLTRLAEFEERFFRNNDQPFDWSQLNQTETRIIGRKWRQSPPMAFAMRVIRAVLYRCAWVSADTILWIKSR